MLNFKQNGQNCLNFLGNKIKRGGPWCKFLDITKMYEIQAEIGAIIFNIKDYLTCKITMVWNAFSPHYVFISLHILKCFDYRFLKHVVLCRFIFTALKCL